MLWSKVMPQRKAITVKVEVEEEGKGKDEEDNKKFHFLISRKSFLLI